VIEEADSISARFTYNGTGFVQSAVS